MPSPLSNLISELKRRRVFWVAAFSTFISELNPAAGGAGRRRAWDPQREQPRFQALVAKCSGG